MRRGDEARDVELVECVINGLAAGKSGFLTLDLQPSTYAAVCLIPDPTSHTSHVQPGMIKQFTVKG